MTIYLPLCGSLEGNDEGVSRTGSSDSCELLEEKVWRDCRRVWICPEFYSFAEMDVAKGACLILTSCLDGTHCATSCIYLFDVRERSLAYIGSHV